MIAQAFISFTAMPAILLSQPSAFELLACTCQPVTSATERPIALCSQSVLSGFYSCSRSSKPFFRLSTKFASKSITAIDHGCFVFPQGNNLCYTPLQ
ncbi:hypothetical protein DER45DRAFT_580534 [Fusarium avenaceum]|nr:hypothetical protein DER45DRAFT_580534 [Fusarium avenaceum]